jgi:hypothetical protein
MAGFRVEHFMGSILEIDELVKMRIGQGFNLRAELP